MRDIEDVETGNPLTAWDFVASIGLLAIGLLLTVLIASFLQWRAEVRQEASALASAGQLTWDLSKQSTRVPTRLEINGVLFTPELVAGCGASTLGYSSLLCTKGPPLGSRSCSHHRA